jgi:hypothetical protein
MEAGTRYIKLRIDSLMANAPTLAWCPDAKENLVGRNAEATMSGLLHILRAINMLVNTF